MRDSPSLNDYSFNHTERASIGARMGSCQLLTKCALFESPACEDK